MILSKTFTYFESSCAIVLDEFMHQVAGHTNQAVKSLQKKYFLKPQVKPDLFCREVEFYERLKKINGDGVVFIPRYYGVLLPSPHVENNYDNTEAFLVLEDITTNYSKPCLIDIKMGTQTFEPTASVDKVQREIRKYPYQAEIGFRITGFKVYNVVNGNYTMADKHFGRSLLPSEVDYGLALCFFDGNNLRVDIIEIVLKKLQKILQFMKQQRDFLFYCSSIFIAYDSLPEKCHENYPETSWKSSSSITKTKLKTHSIKATATTTRTSRGGHVPSIAHEIALQDDDDVNTDTVSVELQEDEVEEEEEEEEEEELVKVYMIDFAHVIISPENEEVMDLGYIHGCTVLIQKLTHLMDIGKKRQQALSGTGVGHSVDLASSSLGSEISAIVHSAGEAAGGRSEEPDEATDTFFSTLLELARRCKV